MLIQRVFSMKKPLKEHPRIKGRFPNLENILLYYSTLLITFSLIGGICIVKGLIDIILNLLFLPVAVYLWISLIKKFRKPKRVE